MLFRVFKHQKIILQDPCHKSYTTILHLLSLQDTRNVWAACVQVRCTGPARWSSTPPAQLFFSYSNTPTCTWWWAVCKDRTVLFFLRGSRGSTELKSGSTFTVVQSRLDGLSLTVGKIRYVHRRDLLVPRASAVHPIETVYKSRISTVTGVSLSQVGGPASLLVKLQV